MKKICEMTHGSRLYGLNTADSDIDYKGIFLPTMEDMVTGNASHEIRHSTGAAHEKNTKDDVDTVYFSLQKFLKMACDGDTIAIDMIHCNDENLMATSPVWQAIVKNRSMFYTRNMKAFLGYCRKQAAKYGVKGTRLAAMEELLNCLRLTEEQYSEQRMGDRAELEVSLQNLAVKYKGYITVMDGFYKGDRFVEKKVVEVCGSKYDFSTKVQYVINSIQHKYDAYGHRAIAAKNNEGIDWKAVSHALRAAYQLKEIYETGDLKYPLYYKDYLLAVKQGKLDFTAQVQPVLEQVISDVEKLALLSDLPEKTDRKYWDGFIVDVYAGKYD
jgi:predicted nucleotidyltransferase